MGTTYLDVIRSIHPDAKLALVGGDDYEHIDWNGLVPIPQSELDAAMGAVALEKAKAEKRKAINKARDAACISDVIAHGRTWQADKVSRELLSDAINLSQAGLPLPTEWRDKSNVNMPVSSLADLLGIAGAMAAQVQTTYQRSWLRKAQIEAATTAEEVEAIQW